MKPFNAVIAFQITQCHPKPHLPPPIQLFLRLSILLLQVPHRHPIPTLTIFHRLPSTAHSQSGLNRTISTPLRTLCLQIRHRGLHLSMNPNHPPITRSRNGLNPMISNPLQTPHPQLSRSFPHQLLSLIRSRTGPNQTTSTPGQSLLQARRSRHGPNPAASHKLPLVASIKLGLGTATFNIHWAIL